MLWLKIYLAAGMLFHKVLWMAMKRRLRTTGAKQVPRAGLIKGLAKVVKSGILLGLFVQIALPDIFPISENAFALRAAGVCLYTLGLAVAISGRVFLGDNWLDIEEAGVSQSQQLVSRGIYRYIRHPIYCGDLLLLLGLELALNSWLVLGVAALIPVVARQALSEQRFLARNLGGYEEYCRRTKGFIPFVV